MFLEFVNEVFGNLNFRMPRKAVRGSLRQTNAAKRDVVRRLVDRRLVFLKEVNSVDWNEAPQHLLPWCHDGAALIYSNVDFRCDLIGYPKKLQWWTLHAGHLRSFGIGFAIRLPSSRTPRQSWIR